MRSSISPTVKGEDFSDFAVDHGEKSNAREESTHTFNFIFPSNLPEDVLGCLSDDEKSILLSPDQGHLMIDKRLNLIAVLILRECLTTSIALHYRAIVPEILTRCIQTRDHPSLSNDLDLTCKKHVPEVDPILMDTSVVASHEVVDNINTAEVRESGKCSKIKREILENTAGESKEDIILCRVIIVLGELVPYLPHLCPLATRALEIIGQRSRSYLSVLTRCRSHSHMVEKLLRSLFRLLLHSAATFSVYVPSFIFLDFLSSNNPMVRSYAINCISYIEGWSNSSRQKLLKRYESPLGNTQPLEYYSPDIMENKITDHLSNETFVHAEGSSRLTSKSQPGIPLDAKLLSSGIVNICGILLNGHAGINGVTTGNTKFFETASLNRPMHQFATTVSVGDSILLEGPPGSGKTALVEYVASQLSVRRMIKLVLNEQSDPKTLIGTYVCSSEPGIFEWKPGVLTTAVKEGFWILIENIDTGPADVISIFNSLLESKYLYISNRTERIAAKSGFQIVATCTDSSQIRINKNLWHHVRLYNFSEADLRSILENAYEYLKPYCVVIINAYNFALKIYSLPYNHHGKKVLMPRDLFKLANRLEQFLKFRITNAIDLKDKEFELKALGHTYDCFFGSLPTVSDRIECCRRLSQIYGVENEHNSFQDINNPIPIFLYSSPNSDELEKMFKNVDGYVQSFVLTETTKRNLRMIYTSCIHNEPILMVGETGTGKTTIVQNIARALGEKLIVVNMSRESELSDLLGGFKPISEDRILCEIYDNFKTLFGNTFNPKTNLSFINAMESAIRRKKYVQVIRGFRKALSAAEIFYRSGPKEASNRNKYSPTSSQDMSSPLSADWRSFADSVDEFERIVMSDTPVRFHFIKGQMAKAITDGDYILLDEINLASKETLDHLSTLIENKHSSVTLLDRGDSAPLLRSPKFRLFACMNPSTDFGKRELDPVFRSRFTEFWISSPAENINELNLLVRSLLKNCLCPDKKESETIVDDISNFYTKIMSLSRDALISDASGMRPNFSPRTLFRALSFTCQIIAFCNIYRAVYEGINLCFLSCLDNKSLDIADALLCNKYKCAARSYVELRHPHYNVPKKIRPRDDYVKVGSFWLKAGPLPRNEGTSEKFVITPSVETNLLNLARAVVCGKHPVLIQGPTSVGKTSIIEFLAKKLGYRFVRINNHQHTEIQEYIGSWAPGPNDGKLTFVEGALLTSLKNGYWIVLDELNMAPSDVIEALDRLLDDNRELLVTETQVIVKPHPNFMLFATQNPAGLYDGRNYLSLALRNRFLELHFSEIPNDELLNILSEKCAIAPSFAKKMMNVYARLQQLRSRSNIFEGRQSYITPRDLFKWANRGALNYEELAINGWFLIGERSRKEEDRAIIKQILEEEIRVNTLDIDKIYSNYFEEIAGSLEKPEYLNDSVAITNSFRRVFVLTYKCIINEEPVLLVGETGIGKTTLCQLMAKILGRHFYMINTHQNSTTQDFIGGQRPLRTKVLLMERIKTNISLLSDEVATEGKYANLSEMNVEEALGFIKNSLSNNISEKAALLLDDTEDMLRRSKQVFCWHDGPLIKAMSDGGLLLIDEISLADSSVVERLNSVLEPEKSLTLAEKCCSEEICTITAKCGFCLLATMNPGGDYGKKELSPALRSRFTEIWAPSIDSKFDMAEIIESKLCSFEDSTSERRLISSWILSFVSWLSNILEKRESDISSIRDLVGWAQFICRTRQSLGLKKSFIHGGCLTLLDGLYANPKFNITPTFRVEGASDAADLVIICKKKLCEIAQEEWCDPNESFKFIGITGKDSDSVQFGIHPFYIDAGPSPRLPDNYFSLEAPTAILNLGQIMRSLQLDKPILLEGPPGVGKTSLVMALASLTGYGFTRINLSDQTDIMDLFGSDLPTEDGGNACSFSWHDGPFLHALKTGRWVLLDELNLADQNVLEGLNSCLDHRKEVYIPDLDIRFKIHPGFRVFAAQNPHSLGGGRKGLPRSFVNRFTVVYIDKMSGKDEEVIMKTLFARDNIRSTMDIAIDEGTLLKMCKFNDLIAKEASCLRICTSMGNVEFNLRDIIRWAKLMKIDLNAYGPEKYLNMLYLHRLRSYRDRTIVKKMFEDTFGYKVLDDTFKSQFTFSKDFIRIGSSIYKVSDEILPPRRSFEDLQVLSSRLPYLESILKCIQVNYLPLLIGPEDSGKTTSLRLLAKLCGRDLVEIPLDSSTDTSDLLGSFEQVNQIKHEEVFMENFNSFVQHIMREKLLNGTPLYFDIPNAFDKINSLGRIALSDISGINDIINTVKNAVSTSELNNDPVHIYKLDSLIKSLRILASSLEQGDLKGRFQWVDGPVTKAIKEGQWIVLENANLCSPSTLDRLNPVFEPGGVLLLSERGLVNGSFEKISINENFRVFMTMDSKYGELSRAMRNRSVEIFMSEEIINAESESFIIGNDMLRLQSAQGVRGTAAIKAIKRLYEGVCDETQTKALFFGRPFLKLNKVFCDFINRGNCLRYSLIQALKYLGSQCGIDQLDLPTHLVESSTSDITRSSPIFRQYLNNPGVFSSMRFCSPLMNKLVSSRHNSVIQRDRIFRAASYFLNSFVFDIDYTYDHICYSCGVISQNIKFLDFFFNECQYVGRSVLESSYRKEKLDSILKILRIDSQRKGYGHIINLDDIETIREHNPHNVFLYRLHNIEATFSTISLSTDDIFRPNFNVERAKKILSSVITLLTTQMKVAIQIFESAHLQRVEDIIRCLEGLSDIALRLKRLNVAHVIFILFKIKRFIKEVLRPGIYPEHYYHILEHIKEFEGLSDIEYLGYFVTFWKGLSVSTKQLYDNSHSEDRAYESNDTLFDYVNSCNIISPEERCKDVVSTLSHISTAYLKDGSNDMNYTFHIRSRSDAIQSYLLARIEHDGVGSSVESGACNYTTPSPLCLFSNDITKLITLPLYDYLCLTHIMYLIKTLLTPEVDKYKDPGLNKSILELADLYPLSSGSKAGVSSLLKISEIQEKDECYTRGLCRDIILDWHVFSRKSVFTAIYGNNLPLCIVENPQLYPMLIVGIYQDIEYISNMAEYESAERCLRIVDKQVKNRKTYPESLPYGILIFYLGDILYSFCGKDRSLVEEALKGLRDTRSNYNNQAKILIRLILSWPASKDTIYCLSKALAIIDNQLSEASSGSFDAEVGKALMYVSLASANIFLSGMMMDPANMISCEISILENQIEGLITERDFLLELYNFYLVTTTRSDKIRTIESQIGSKKCMIEMLSKCIVNRTCMEGITRELYNEISRQRHQVSIDTIEEWIRMLQSNDTRYNIHIQRIVDQKIQSLELYIPTHGDIVKPIISAFYNVKYSAMLISSRKNCVLEGTALLSSLLFTPNHTNIEDMNIDEFKKEVISGAMMDIVGLTNGQCFIPLLYRIAALILVGGRYFSDSLSKANFVVSYMAQLCIGCDRRRVAENLRKSSLYRPSSSISDNEADELEQELPCGRREYRFYERCPNINEDAAINDNNPTSQESKPNLTASTPGNININAMHLVKPLYILYHTHISAYTDFGLLDVDRFSYLWKTSASYSSDIIKMCTMNNSDFHYSTYNDYMLCVWGHKMLEGLASSCCPVDIYRDPYVSEVKRIRPFCITIHRRLQKLLDKWSMHDVLLTLHNISRKLLTLSISTPLPKVLYAILVLLSRMYDWEKHASREDSLKGSIDEACGIVCSWRKIELECWKMSLDIEEKKYGDDSTSKTWLYLWSLVNFAIEDKGISEELVSALNEYMATSSLGDFSARLKAISICYQSSYSTNNGEVSCILANIIGFYSQFKEFLSKELEARKSPILTKLMDRINTRNMKNVVYYSMKEVYDSDNRKLLRIIRDYRHVLSSPIQELLSDYILRDFSGRVYAESLTLQKAVQCDSTFPEHKTPIIKTMRKLFDEQFFIPKLDLVVYVKDLISEVNDHVERFRNKDERVCKDECVYKKRLALRRTNLGRLFKELKALGIHYRRAARKVTGIIDMRKLLLMQPADSSVTNDVPTACDHFITFAKIEKLKALQPVAHQDISKNESTMCISFIDNLLDIQITIRESLLASAKELKLLKGAFCRVDSIKDSVCVLVSRHHDLLETLTELKNCVDSVSTHIAREACLELSISANEGNFDVHSLVNEAKIIKSDVDSLLKNVSESSLGLLSSQELKIILGASSNLKHIISSLYSCVLNLRPEELSHLQSTYNKVDHFLNITLERFTLGCKTLNFPEAQDTTEDAQLSLMELQKCTLSSLQSLLGKRNDDDDLNFSDFQLQVSKRLAKLRINNLRLKLEGFLDKAHPQVVYAHSSEYLREYIRILEDTHGRLSGCYSAISLLSLLLSNLFLCLHVSGFCLELQSEEQQSQCENETADGGVVSAVDSARDTDNKFDGELNDLKNISDKIDDESDIQEDRHEDNGSCLSLDMSSGEGEYGSISGDSDLESNISDEYNNKEDNDTLEAEPYNEALWDNSSVSDEDGNCKRESDSINADPAIECETPEQDTIAANDDEKDGSGSTKHDQKGSNYNLRPKDDNADEGSVSSKCSNELGEDPVGESHQSGDDISDGSNMDLDDNNDAIGEDCEDIPSECQNKKADSVQDENVSDNCSDEEGCNEDGSPADAVSSHGDMSLCEEDHPVESDEGINEGSDNHSRSIPARYDHSEQEMEAGLDGDPSLGGVCSQGEEEYPQIRRQDNNDSKEINNIPLQGQTEDNGGDYIMDVADNEASMGGAAAPTKDNKRNALPLRRCAPKDGRVGAEESMDVVNNVIDTSRDSYNTGDDMETTFNNDVNFEFIKDEAEKNKSKAQAFAEALNDQVRNANAQFPKDLPDLDRRSCEEVKYTAANRISTKQKSESEVAKESAMNDPLNNIHSDDMDVSHHPHEDQDCKSPGIVNTEGVLDGVRSECSIISDDYEALCEKLIASNISGTDCDNPEKLKVARELWNTYAHQTSTQVARLNEQLQLILKPTLVSRLKGDYKTGKRLNIRKLIPYIASSYRKDRIWMRRTHPGKRCYQVMLCIDDSLSMSEMKCVQLAYKSLVVISKSLTMSEIGDVCVMNFGEELKILHPFGRPITDDVGARIFTQFTFNQRRTLMTRVMGSALRIFRQSSHLIPQSSLSHRNLKLKRLQIVISDGICEDHDKIRSICRLGADIDLMTVFVILDTKPGAESIRNIKNVVYNSAMPFSQPTFTISKYMETFPFDYFAIISNVEMLTDVLSDIIRQYVELSSPP